MKIPSMMDIHNNTLRRVVLIVFLIPATVIAVAVYTVEALIEAVQELPGAIRTVWRSQK